MALALVVDSDKIRTGLVPKVNEVINNTPTGYAVSGGVLTITKFDTTTDTVELPAVRNQVVSGGDYTRMNNLAYDIAPVTYTINNETFTIAVTTSLSFNNGDATDDRFDIVVLEEGNTMRIIEGTPDANPVIPTIANNEVLLLVLYVPANAVNGGTDVTVTYWAGYEPNVVANELVLYKEKYTKGAGASATGSDAVAIGKGAVASAEGEVRIKGTQIKVEVSGGVQYAADYSANYTDRSLIDKGFVGANYLDLSGGTMAGNIRLPEVFELGGINGTGTVILIDNQESFDRIISLQASYEDEFFESKYSQIDIKANGIFINGYSNAGFGGVQYAADYSANYTDRSLVDRAYVDKRRVTLITGTYSVQLTDDILYATTGGFTITLPNATTCLGSEFTIKRYDGGGGSVTLDTAGGNIDGAASKTLGGGTYVSFTVVSNGTNYMILSEV
jgi:hypothetical protein